MPRFYFIPDSYHPDQKTMDLAKSLGLSEKDVTYQLEKCKDHQYKRPMIDPDRCFRNWLRNAIKFGDAVPTVHREYRQPEEYTAEQKKADEAKAWRELERLKAVKK